MDYYYALLENYKQLKQRRFKLSLREQEEDAAAESGGGCSDPAECKTEKDKVDFLVQNAGEEKEEAPPAEESPDAPDADAPDADAPDKEGGDEEAPKEEPGNIIDGVNGQVRLWKSKTGGGQGTEKEAGGGGESVLAADVSDPKGQAAAVVQDTKLGSSPGALALLGLIFGGAEDEDEAATDDDPQSEEGKEAADAAKLQAEVEKAGTEASEALGKMIDTAQEGQNPFPGLEIKTTGASVPKTLQRVLEGESDGYSAAEVEQLGITVLNSPEPPSMKQKLEALQSFKESITVLQTLQGQDIDTMQPKERQKAIKQLKESLESMEIARKGVMVKGVFFFYRAGGSDSKSDVVRNMADQLIEKAKEYNSKWGTEEGKLELPGVAAPPKNGGADESYRGPTAEKFMSVSVAIFNGQQAVAKCTANISGYSTESEAKAQDCRKEAVANMKKELAEVYEKAMEDGSYDRMMKVFSRGSSVSLGEEVGDIEAMEDANFVMACQKILVERRGMSPEDAEQFLAEAAGCPDVDPDTPGVQFDAGCTPDKQLGRALIISTMVNQELDQQLFGIKEGEDPALLPTRISHSGADDSESSGRKSDIVFEWDDADCNAIQEHYEKKLGATAGTFKGGAATKGCAEQEGTGADNLVLPGTPENPEAGGCHMNVELKTLTSAESTGGAGESSPSRITAICNDAPVVDNYSKKVLAGEMNAEDGMTQATKEFRDKNIKRMDDCLGEGTSDKACDVHKKIQARADKFRSLLSPPTPKERSQLVLKTWFQGKSKSTRMVEREKAAQRAINAGDNATPEDLKQLDKVKRDMEQMVLMQEIHRSMGGSSRQRAGKAGETIEGLPAEEEGFGAPEEELPGIAGSEKEEQEGEAWAQRGRPTPTRAKSDKYNLLRRMERGDPERGGEGRVSSSDLQAYMAMEFTTACGSTTEVLRVTRGLDDDYQSTYLNNANQAEMLRQVSEGEATWQYEGGGTINLVGKDGKTLATADTARGGWKWEMKKDTKHKLGEAKVAKSSPSLLVQFLKGQQAILEKLIDQTT